MAAASLELSDFLDLTGTTFDVRSPGEFAQGRIPGVLNLPLFDDQERSIVGTLYKHSGKEAAIEQGLRFAGPKFADFVVTAKQRMETSCAKIYCWRGGMRSEAMAWLLNTAGIKSVTLRGGYKTFRRWALNVLKQPRSLIVLGGATGSGKTALLHELQEKGEQVIDLESLAHHRGSTYGMLGQPPQPTVEQFENELAVLWAAADPLLPLWIEDESRMIGRCKIPDPIYQFIRSAKVVFIDSPLEERLNRLLLEYGHIPLRDLIIATERLSRRLGGQQTGEIIKLIQAGQLKEAFRNILYYYDRTYAWGLSSRKQQVIKIEGVNFEKRPDKLKKLALNLIKC